MPMPARPFARSPLGRIVAALLATACGAASAQTAPTAWQNRALSADARADLLVKAMTEDEKLTVVTGLFGANTGQPAYRRAEARPQSAGYVPGIPRLGFTPQWQSDAGSGVATQGAAPPALERTALPSGILSAASWDPAAAMAAGAVVGAESRASGFNEQLAGGVDLDRDPGNGRNFEYGGEDPWLAGTMVGAFVKGIQSNRIVSTVKHYAFNDQETGRNFVNIAIDKAAARMSDLLAFQIAIEQSDAGSVMCSYNLVNGAHSCQNDWLLNQVLKKDWGFKGFVMSDWGAQHDAVADALGGLDQETGVGLSNVDYHVWLDKLKAAIASGQVPMAVLDDKVRRIARALIATGAVDDPVAPGTIDYAAHAAASQHAAEQGIVLLKNEGGVLPLAAKARRIAVFGGHADKGVLSGGGSAQVYSPGGTAVPDPDAAKGFPHPVVYYKSSPVEGLKGELPGATIDYADGDDRAAAARLAAHADVAIVFVTQWTAESQDFPLTLPNDQDALVQAVAAANPNTVVVLETGAAVTMPWAGKVKGIVEAWYPGTRGGAAIGRVLAGKVNPSGHLPISFPRSADQYPRPGIPGLGLPEGQPFTVRYTEGAAVGYKWLDKTGAAPLFAFGHGLSYTRFQRDALAARVDGDALQVSFRLRNSGSMAGADVGQIYVAPVAGGWEAPKRLGGYRKVMLAPGAAQTVALMIDPRLLATWDEGRHGWHVAAGRYRVTLAASAVDTGSSVTVALPERWLPAGRGATLASR